MYLSSWVVYGTILVIVWLLWGQWTAHKQVTVVRGCYLEMSDWTQELTQDLDRVGGDGGGNEQQWERMVVRHGLLMRRRGVSLHHNWAEYDVRFEKV